MISGRDARLPSETVLSTPPTLQMLEVDDYKTKSVTGLTECWKIACTLINEYYDHFARQVSDRVMAFMPQKKTKDHFELLKWEVIVQTW